MCFRAALLLAALSLAACQQGNAGRDPDATEPAGTQAPGAQQEAAPQTEPNSEQGDRTQAPPPGPAPGARSYDECMRGANAAKTEGEREVLARTCGSLPDAPKQ